MSEHKAIIIGSGPNGLAAGIVLAQAGWQVTIHEAADTIGGGTRTAELTNPGFHHDVCAAVHPLAVASPFFRTLALEQDGLEFVHPDLPLAHPLDDGDAAFLARSMDETASGLGPDGVIWRRLMQPWVVGWDHLLPSILGPPRFPDRPFLLARFGLNALRSVAGLARRFQRERTRALLAGLGAHAMLPLDRSPGAAFALVLGVAGHAAGWPVVKGGSQRLAEALAACLMRHGGRLESGRRIESVDELPSNAIVLFDVTPRQLVRLARAHLPPGYRRRLERHRYGMGVFKVDYALSAPVPWKAEPCRRAGTVHVGGTLQEIAVSERNAWEGRPGAQPFVLVVQPSLWDSSRAPIGRHTLWPYCHVPNGSTADMTEAIDRQIERFAPGFRDTILARHTRTAVDMEAYNPNYVGGDINGGVLDLRGFLQRPTFGPDPYATPNPRLFICSSSTPPGGGVHGMCGYHAAQSVLRHAS